MRHKQKSVHVLTIELSRSFFTNKPMTFLSKKICINQFFSHLIHHNKFKPNVSSLSEILCNTLARIFDRVAACCCCCCRYAIERKKAQIELSSPRNTILHRTYTVCRCLCICITIEKQNKMNWSQIHIARFVWVVISVKTNIFFCIFGKHLAYH